MYKKKAPHVYLDENILEIVHVSILLSWNVLNCNLTFMIQVIKNLFL